MPINFPDTWGAKAKKEWLPLSQNKTPVVKKQPKAERLDSQGRMKCPECGRWVKVFWVTSEQREFGTIDDRGDVDYHDSENEGFEISCPECNHEVFHSNTSELEDYYHPSP